MMRASHVIDIIQIDHLRSGLTFVEGDTHLPSNTERA